MIRVYFELLGLSQYIELDGVQSEAPALGDRIMIIAKECKKPSRLLLERTPAYRCFERNEQTEHLSLGEFLADKEFTVSERKWSYEENIPHCYLSLDYQIED